MKCWNCKKEIDLDSAYGIGVDIKKVCWSCRQDYFNSKERGENNGDH